MALSVAFQMISVKLATALLEDRIRQRSVTPEEDPEWEIVLEGKAFVEWPLSGAFEEFSMRAKGSSKGFIMTRDWNQGTTSE